MKVVKLCPLPRRSGKPRCGATFKYLFANGSSIANCLYTLVRGLSRRGFFRFLGLRSSELLCAVRSTARCTAALAIEKRANLVNRILFGGLDWLSNEDKWSHTPFYKAASRVGRPYRAAEHGLLKRGHIRLLFRRPYVVQQADDVVLGNR